MSREYRATHYPPETMEICEENIRDLFQFIYDRHELWRNRFIHKLPREKWTNNPILKEYKYTNSYRELDRGSIWYIQNVVEPYVDKYDSLYDSSVRNKQFEMFKKLVWETTVYRLCNRIETFEEVGLPDVNNYDDKIIHNDFYNKLDKIYDRGDSVMTSAHLTCPTPAGYTKVEGYMMAINDLHQNLDYVCKDIINAKKSKDVFDAICSVYCVGNFIGYEVLCDLMYSKSVGCNNVPFKEDDWANVGPGAIEGIRMTFPSTKGKTNIYNRMVQLRDEQNKWFDLLGIKFNYYEKFTKGHVSLRVSEHMCCEYQKFYLQKRNLGKQRMILKPNENRVVNGRIYIINPLTGDSGAYLYVNDNRIEVDGKIIGYKKDFVNL